MTPQEKDFALLVARSDGSDDAVRCAYRQAFSIEPGKRACSFAGRMHKLLKREDVALEVDAQRAAAIREEEIATKELRAKGIDIAKARLVLREESYLAAVAVQRAIVAKVAKGGELTSADAKALEVSFKVTGDMGADVQIDLRPPTSTDRDELLQRVREQAAALGFQLPPLIQPAEVGDA